MLKKRCGNYVIGDICIKFYSLSLSLSLFLCIGSTPTFLYFDLYLYSAYAAHYIYSLKQPEGVKTGIEDYSLFRCLSRKWRHRCREISWLLNNYLRPQPKLGHANIPGLHFNAVQHPRIHFCKVPELRIQTIGKRPSTLAYVRWLTHLTLLEVASELWAHNEVVLILRSYQYTCIYLYILVYKYIHNPSTVLVYGNSSLVGSRTL